MPIFRLLLNLSVLGKNPTGFGVCTRFFASVLTRHRKATVLSCDPDAFLGDQLPSPPDIVFGAGKLAALERFFFLRSIRLDDGWLLISPTHHGLPSARRQIITIHDLIALHAPRQHIRQWLFFRFGATIVLGPALRQRIWRAWQLGQRADVAADAALQQFPSAAHRHVQGLGHRFFRTLPLPPVLTRVRLCCRQCLAVFRGSPSRRDFKFKIS